ncbi:uncharacterized protein LOC128954863 [Oppia nitens]|uniref:uncharacterized protein LOC128954863 n=1 Tax=Oppia nitens TaxID=1686743 RepID=UPI0023DC3AEF|nr:uncharacterized protein LOC128954863 [Oppia nitens]
MKQLLLATSVCWTVLLLWLSIQVDGKTIEVGTAKELSDALESVKPGDTIKLADGTYHSKFVAETSGTKSAPITLTGSRKAVLSGSNYGFWLKANHWHLRGFTVTNSNKGIVLDGGNHNLLEELEVHNIKQEGIHFRLHSSDNVLRNSYIHTTGTGSPGFGEGVYIGSAVSNWPDGKPDKSDRNEVSGNRIGPDVAAEEIDIKEGSCCGIIKDNTFDGTGMSGENYADSWIDVKGEGYTIENNSGDHTLLDGIQIHIVKDADMGGCGNKIVHTSCKHLAKKGVCVNDTTKNCKDPNIIEK